MTQMRASTLAVAVRRPEVVAFPPRTFLYHLAPYEAESIWCESLTSYVNRLAWTHHVSPRALVAQVINPLLSSPIPFVAAFGPQAAMGLNGTGAQASTWAEVVGQLTGRADLCRLTFAPFLGDFPSKRLLRLTPAWCPVCLMEWKAAERPLYQPLLWMLLLVTHCPVHHTLLIDRCPACHKRQKVLATNKTRPFECTSCTAWLGDTSSVLPEEEETMQILPWQTWLIFALEELRAASLKEGNLSWKPFFFHLADYLRNQHAYARLAGILGMRRENLHKWVHHQNAALKTALTFCYRCELTPWQMIQGDLSPLERILRAKTCRPSPLPPRRTLPFDRERSFQYLQTVLREENTAPPSLRQIERDLGIAAGLLTMHFPEESAQVVQRHAAYRQHRKEQRVWTLRENVRQAVFSLHAQGEYPLRYKLGAIFPNGAMRLPEATEAWREALLELGLDPENQRKTQVKSARNSG